MVEKLIIADDRFGLFLIPTTHHNDWINFRVRCSDPGNAKRSRLAYSRSERRLSEGHSTRNFREKNPEDLAYVVKLIERAIKQKLI